MKKRRFADGGETPALDRLASGEDTGRFDTDVYARAKRFLAEQGKAKPAASSAKPSGARSVTNTGDETARLRARYPAPALGAGAGRGGRGGPTAEEMQAYQAEKRGAGAGRGFVNRTAKDVAEETGMRARDSEAANSRGMRRVTDTGDETARLRARRPSPADEMKSAGDDLDRIQQAGYARGGKVKGYAKGGSIDGCAQRGKTKGRYL